MKICENVTTQARETYARLVAAKFISRAPGCDPDFAKYEFKAGVLATALGSQFATPLSEGVDGDHIALTTNDNSTEVLLDIVLGTDSIAANIGFGDVEWSGQKYPKPVGGAGSSIATNVGQGAFLTPLSREGGVKGLNVSCLRPFSQLSALKIALKTYTGALLADLPVMIITGKLDGKDARWTGPQA